MSYTYKVSLYNSFFPRYIRDVGKVQEPAFGQSYVTFLDQDQMMIARFRASDVQSIERVVQSKEDK